MPHLEFKHDGAGNWTLTPPEQVKVVFVYDPLMQGWDMYVHGTNDELTARQACISAVMTAQLVIPDVEAIRALPMGDKFKISVGVNVAINPNAAACGNTDDQN